MSTAQALAVTLGVGIGAVVLLGLLRAYLHRRVRRSREAWARFASRDRY